MQTLKTREQARKEFYRRGMSVAGWAKANNFNVPNTYQLLNGRNKGLRGECHRIAVALGIKDGVA